MSSFKKRMNATNIKLIVSFVLIAMLSLAVVFAFVKIDKNEKTKTLGANSFTYAIGILDSEGNYEQGTTSIYTKDYHSVDGLTVELKDDATVTYKVFFYDENEDFVGVASDLSGISDIVENANSVEYFRVMITPTNDAEVSFFEIDDYAGQLTITINK